MMSRTCNPLRYLVTVNIFPIFTSPKFAESPKALTPAIGVVHRWKSWPWSWTSFRRSSARVDALSTDGHVWWKCVQVPSDINRSSSNFEWLRFEVFGGVVRRPSTYPRQGFTSLLQLGIWAKWLEVQNSYDGGGSLLGHHWIILLWRWFSVEVLVVAPLVFTSFHHVFENLFMLSTSIHHSLPIVFFESRVSGYGSETRLVEPSHFLHSLSPSLLATGAYLISWEISSILSQELDVFTAGALGTINLEMSPARF